MEKLDNWSCVLVICDVCFFFLQQIYKKGGLFFETYLLISYSLKMAKPLSIERLKVCAYYITVISTRITFKLIFFFNFLELNNLQLQININQS